MNLAYHFRAQDMPKPFQSTVGGSWEFRICHVKGMPWKAYLTPSVTLQADFEVWVPQPQSILAQSSIKTILNQSSITLTLTV